MITTLSLSVAVALLDLAADVVTHYKGKQAPSICSMQHTPCSKSNLQYASKKPSTTLPLALPCYSTPLPYLATLLPYYPTLLPFYPATLPRYPATFLRYRTTLPRYPATLLRYIPYYLLRYSATLRTIVAKHTQLRLGCKAAIPCVHLARYTSRNHNLIGH